MKLLTSTLKLNEAAMINANAMDAKGITNDLPLSLSISTESTLFKTTQGSCYTGSPCALQLCL